MKDSLQYYQMIPSQNQHVVFLLPLLLLQSKSVFTPTATLTQHVGKDWIVPCLHIIINKKVAKYKDGQGDSIFSESFGRISEEEIIKTEYYGSNSSQTTTSLWCPVASCSPLVLPGGAEAALLPGP